jgi:hypothetical protein
MFTYIQAGTYFLWHDYFELQVLAHEISQEKIISFSWESVVYY